MLTDAQVELFNTQGFLVIENVLDEETVLRPLKAEYNARLDQLMHAWVAEGRVPDTPRNADFFEKLLHCYAHGVDWFQPLDISLPGDRITADTPFHFGPAVFDLISSPTLLDIVQQLLGPEITSNPIQHVRLKPPSQKLHSDEIRAHITHTDWHQDRGVAHGDADATRMVTVWCAITDATLDNGCLQVIPKNGSQSLLPHCPKSQTAIADGLIDYALAQPLPVKAGGVVIFDPLTPHASRDNNSERFRWSFDIRYNQTGRPTGRSHFPSFAVRSAAAPERVLRDWQVWMKMWEDARAELAQEAHIPIHRWTSDAPACA